MVPEGKNEKMSNELTVEKLNAQRITNLEDRLEKSVAHLDSKIDKVLEVVQTKSSNGNGNGYTLKAVAVVFSILLPMAGMAFTLMGQATMSLERKLDAHMILDAHPKALQINAEQEATLRAINEKMKSVEERVENFKQERARINELEKDSGVLISRTSFIPQILSWQSEHDEKVAGINSAQDARLDSVELAIENTNWDKVSASEGDMIKERISTIEAEQRRRSTAGQWKE